MKISRNKTIATAIATILVLSMTLTMFAIPIANAAWDSATLAAVSAGMKWDFPNAANYNASTTRLLLWSRFKDQIPTWVYEVLSPNPVGVGQQVSIIMFNPQVPNAAYDTNNIRYHYTITVTKPDGKVETLPATGTFTSDSTGSAYTLYTVEMLGNYTFTVKFHELLYTWYSTSSERNYYGVTLKESSYTKTLTVQQEQVIPTGWTPVPLPTEYWTRPIEGMNTQWYRVASNWLGNAKDAANGGPSNRYQTDGTAPTSGHIIWTKPTEDGGVVGGANFSTVGEVYNAGHQYQTRFTQQIIMMGKLYYLGPRYWDGDGDIYRCVDLKTGQTIWEKNVTIGVDSRGRLVTATPAFGYQYDWDDMNQHGVVNPGMLFTEDFAKEYHPLYGDATSLNITNVPTGGFEIVGPKGEVLRYVFNNAGNATKPDYRLVQWNSSRVFTEESSGTINASIALAHNIDWNVSASWRNTMGSSVTLRAAQLGDVLLGSNGSNPSRPAYDYPDAITFWAVSLKPGNIGQLLWTNTINTVTSDNTNLLFRRAAEGVFVFERTPICSWVGYSMYTGQKLFETEAESEFNPFGYYASSSGYNIYGNKIAYNKLFTGGYTGAVSAYDLTSGELLWRYTAPTNMEIFPYYTLMLGALAEGKLYVGTHEHSADTPLFKGNRVRCLNVTTGEEIWTMYGWANPQSFAIADGTLIYWNNYDHQIYAVAKGPSQMKVEAPMAGVTVGNSLVIRGTVTDISPGTEQLEQAKRFPNGVPAVSDASQSAWMEYVYMQKPRPMNATGVPVTLSVLDSNNNYRDIGTATSNSDGFFTFSWKPDIEGQYTVYASFAGSESYWPSHAVTSFAVDPAVAPTQTPEYPQPVDNTMTIVGVGIALLAAIVIGFAFTMLMLRKRP